MNEPAPMVDPPPWPISLSNSIRAFSLRVGDGVVEYFGLERGGMAMPPFARSWRCSTVRRTRTVVLG